MYAFRDNYLKNSLYEGKIFNVGIYLRVSREDGNLSESESILNQKEQLTRYVIKNGWNLIDYYIDDGFTGTNFDRPGFKSLIDDININRINMVVTKDLSRLGRDYIETGYYIERYFPEKNIRYIAVNDGLDTFDTNNSNNDMSPFKSVINDMYAKDISKKVRASINSKVESGKFIGAFAPYGYRKSKTDKNKLIVDENVAYIVTRIFNMYLNGYGYSSIAHALNEERIPSPGQYKASYSNYRNRAGAGLWTHETIKTILINPTYAGHLTQSKYYKVSYKVKKLKNVRRDLWVTVKNTHEPVIDQGTFNQVQQLISSNVQGGRHSILDEDYSKLLQKHLLSGLVFCGDCGERMTFTKTGKGLSYGICSKYKRFKACTRHSIREDEINKYVLSELSDIAGKVLDRERLVNAVKDRRSQQKQNDGEIEIITIKNRLNEIKRTLKRLYEDKIKGIVSEQDFIDFSNDYNKEREHLNKRLDALYSQKSQSEEQQKKSDDFAELIKKIVSFDDPQKSILIQIIDRIEIFENKSIKMSFKIKNPYL